ncbi:MAG TPA: 16S rRNA (cytosine(1402)-N(4))-methyltransferase RsmH [Bacteroidales bacterium]|nr:16S rRNA (cytosine(1402)-N(4))-methyltransferase RsmH [Bacteroidales bacterium]HPS46275.1 16S rRNA (cytosine(1402)-N(4))-methyltransferase RsmH [Bacteroidales bacterium]HQH18943.1 16S rRNA (cytosine(1402)-N(4))-methyltransferase RsmH [Bacteroidales bacterium]HQI45791.1 16S rRNA (cytosine(1402)-N(4))-methyltransferase RsmH [Bacteroidales bacterium]
MTYHDSVLLKQSVDGLDIRPNGVYVDVTFGGGGHSKEILNKLNQGKLFAFDQDEDALQNTLNDTRFTLINANFKYLKNFLRYYKIDAVDGIIADLGISSYQIDNPERGFSTRYNSELDLRMDRRNQLSAQKILSEYNEEALSKVFYEYGEIKQSRRIAQTIVSAREKNQIITVEDLKNVTAPFAERGKENKFYAQLFQSLRIEINQEMEVLKELLVQSLRVLKPNGRLVVIAYHSLEDRIVKNFMKSGNFEGAVEKDFFGNEQSPFTLITRKPIVPSESETEINKRARSAKLRIAEKK